MQHVAECPTHSFVSSIPHARSFAAASPYVFCFLLYICTCTVHTRAYAHTIASADTTSILCPARFLLHFLFIVHLIIPP